MPCPEGTTKLRLLVVFKNSLAIVASNIGSRSRVKPKENKILGCSGISSFHIGQKKSLCFPELNFERVGCGVGAELLIYHTF